MDTEKMKAELDIAIKVNQYNDEDLLGRIEEIELELIDNHALTLRETELLRLESQYLQQRLLTPKAK